VIARFCGIVVRLLCLGQFGTRLHAFHGDSELVVDLSTLRVLSDTTPEWVRFTVLSWAEDHQPELLRGTWRFHLPLSAQPAAGRVWA